MGLMMNILDAAERAIAKPNADEAEVDVLSEGDDSDEALVNWTEGGKKKSATGNVAKSTLAQMTLQTVSIPQNFAGLESVSTPTRLRYQIFTIVSVDEQDDYVEVVANHIFYEQATNYTVWTPETLVNYSCGAICRNVMANTINGNEGFKVATDCTEQLPWHQIDYARKNLIEVFLDPENGICRKFNLNLVRDNMNFYVLKNVGYDRGFVIEDKKNLLGVQRQENIKNTVTRIAAYGKDKDGNILWLNNNGKKYVDSQYISNYKHPRVEIYDTGVQITGDKEAELLHNQGRDSEIVTAENINDKIYNAAVKRFTEDHVDDPEVTMKVDFVSLGDTEEYKQYRDLDKVYLYDIVHVKHSGRDYSYGAQVIGVEHDILTGILLSVTIGNIVSWDGIRKVANWQVPEIDGSIIRMHSITASQYDYGSVTGNAIKDEAVSGNHINVPSVSAVLDIDKLKEILAQAGLVLGDDGILIYQNSDDNMLQAKLSVQADRITSEVTRATEAEGQMSTRISQTAEAITSEVTRATNAEGTLSTRITQTADSITAEVTRAQTAEDAISGRLTVEADKVAMVVGTQDGTNFIKAAEIATSINNAGEGVATINASHVNISATNTLHTLAGAIEEDDNGNVTIVSAGGMRVRKTSGGTTAEFGVFDSDNLTAGVIVDKVNGGTVTIKGSKVWVGDASTDQTLKKWATESDGLFAQNIGALSARIGTIEADYITADDITANKIRALVDGGTFSSLTTTSLSVGGQTIGPSTVISSVSGVDNGDGTYTLSFTRPGGSAVNYFTFSKAAQLVASWSGATYTVTAGSDSRSTTIATGSGSNGWVLSNDRLYHNVYADGAARLSDDYDLSSYKATQRAAGAASVTVSAAGWQGGSNVVSASNGKSVTVSMPAVTMSSGNWSSHKKTVYAYSSAAGITGYIASHEVDASTEYSSGVTAGNTAAGVTSSWSNNTFTVTRAANTSTKSLSCIVTITPSSAKTLGFGESVTVKALGNASEKASVVITAPAEPAQRTVYSLSKITMAASETGTDNSKSTTVTFTDNNTQTAYVYVDTSAVYTAGYNAGYNAGYSKGVTDTWSTASTGSGWTGDTVKWPKAGSVGEYNSSKITVVCGDISFAHPSSSYVTASVTATAYRDGSTALASASKSGGTSV